MAKGHVDSVNAQDTAENLACCAYELERGVLPESNHIFDSSAMAARSRFVRPDDSLRLRLDGRDYAEMAAISGRVCTAVCSKLGM
jgi:hypothetical protein